MKRLILTAVVLGLLYDTAMAQTVKTTFSEVTCPADGTSIELAPARNTRIGYMVVNSSDTAIRYGVAASGTADLDATNSVVVAAGNAPSDNVPMVTTERLVCMSTTGVAKVVGIVEKYRP
jgi:hypothetical protein